MRLIRRLVPAVQAARSWYWRIAKPTSLWVKGIIAEGGNVLLVRYSSTDGWRLPGGRVKRGETILDALWRELREKLGLRPSTTPPQLLGLYVWAREARRDYVGVYIVNSAAIGGVDMVDDIDWQVFSLDALPAVVSPGTRRRLDEFQGIRQIDHIW